MLDQDADNVSEDSPSKEEDSAIGEAPRKRFRKCREKVSWVWQYFIKEGSVAVCQFCQASFSFSSTTTLSYHLNHVHENLDLVKDKAIVNPHQKSNRSKVQQISSESSSPLKNTTNVSKAAKSSLPSIFSDETAVLISKVLGESPNDLRVANQDAGRNENKNRKLSKGLDAIFASSPKGKAKRRREKVSWVWAHFVKDENVAVCQFCNASFSSASTTTLGYHLNNLHKDLLNNGTTVITLESTETDAEENILEISSMPHLKITTNISKRSIPSTFLKDSSAMISMMLSQPESQCVVTVVPDRMMLWGGEEGPCAILCLNGVGTIEDHEDKNYSKILIDHMKKHLGISITEIPELTVPDGYSHRVLTELDCKLHLYCVADAE